MQRLLQPPGPAAKLVQGAASGGMGPMSQGCELVGHLCHGLVNWKQNRPLKKNNAL